MKLYFEKFIPPQYYTGDVVYIGEATGYTGHLDVRGDINKFPETLDPYVRKIYITYVTNQEPIYSIEVNSKLKHHFEQDVDSFYDWFISELNNANITVVD